MYQEVSPCLRGNFSPGWQSITDPSLKYWKILFVCWMNHDKSVSSTHDILWILYPDSISQTCGQIRSQSDFSKNAAVVGARNTVDWDAAMQWCGKRCQLNQMWHIFQISKSRKNPLVCIDLKHSEISKDGIFNRILTVLNVLFSFSCHPGCFRLARKMDVGFTPDAALAAAKGDSQCCFMHPNVGYVGASACGNSPEMVVLGQKHSEES